MFRPRLSVARLLAVVAVVALDCGLVRLFLIFGDNLQGLFSFGLAMSLAVVGVLSAGGRLK